MYRMLFQLSSLAMLGWLLFIFAPTWRVTRRIADSALFPAYIAFLYLVGVVAVFRELGFGIMADFGSADGVLRLLTIEGVALVAWIHILAFDQVVAHLIYRDNMKHRFIPIPLQSVLLFLTLMLGPLGFLTYWLIRVTRSKRLVAWGDAVEVPKDPADQPVRFDSVVTQRSVIPAALGLLRRERGLTLVSLAGFALALITTAIAFIHGDWLLGAEGRLKEAVRFDVAIAIFTLTLALLLPLAGMSETGRRRWRNWTIGLTIYAYLMENVQSWRGLDPRFSKVAGVFDQVLGGVFFLQAIGLLILFVVLTSRFFRDDELPDHEPLRIALRYGALAANLAFFVGVIMSGIQGRTLNRTGDLIWIHAAGFHGLQTVPLVALLLGWSNHSAESARRWVHIAGMGWMLFCAALVAQAGMGMPLLSSGWPSALAVAGLAVWAAALAVAWSGRRSGLTPVSAPA
jgi:hypothetical protein